MLTPKRQFGDIGEGKAIEFLKKKGYKILARNWRHRLGEVDIVAIKTSGAFLKKTKELVFVEVKTIEDDGSQNLFSLAAQNVHFAKQRRLIRAAKIYLAEKKIAPQIPWQIDVLLVALNPQTGSVKIEHLENAVWGG